MSEQLFDTGEQPTERARTPVPAADAPLAVRMRPRSLDELIGQQHLLAEGSSLRTAIETGEPHSMVLYGPPGTGKTTLARIVAQAARGAFEEESAVNAGRGRGPQGDRARRRAPARHRPADDLLPRRDPPLQQGSAGCAAARRRGGTGDPDRRDHREPVLRGQLGAALAQPDLRAAGARSRAGHRGPAAGAGRPGARDRRGAGGRRRRGGPARRALRRRCSHGARGARARHRGGRRRRRRRDRPGHGRGCVAAQGSELRQAAATSTTTTPRR